MPELSEKQTPPTPPVQPSGISGRDSLILTLGIIIALVVGQILRPAADAPPPTASASQSQGLQPDAPPALDEKAVRQEAWHRIQPRLKDADLETRELTNQLIYRIEDFFDSGREGAKAFAEAALSWESKWELIKSREGHREFLTQQFCEYIFTQDDLASMLREAASEYALGLKGVENELLVQVRADIEDLPTTALPAFENPEALAAQYEAIAVSVAADVAAELRIDVVQGVTTFATAELAGVLITNSIRAVATRLGVSAAIFGGGAAASWATFGAGIAVAIVADYMIDVMISMYHNPVENLAAKVIDSLDRMKQSITTGAPEAWTIHNKVERMSKEHADSAIRASAEKTVAAIRNSGNLGLRYALGRLADAQHRSRELTLQKLILEGGTL